MGEFESAQDHARDAKASQYQESQANGCQSSCACLKLNPARGSYAQQQNYSVCNSPREGWRIDSRRPISRAGSVIEVAGDRHCEHRAFDGHVEHVAPPNYVSVPEHHRGQTGNVESGPVDHWLHRSSARLRMGALPFGQIHPIKVIITRGANHTTAHCVKMDPTKRMLTATAARNGQMLGAGSSSL